MNLIKEINAFYKLDMPGQLSFSAQSLYMALLHTANEIYSRDVSPSNTLLMAKTGIKDVKTLEKARQELIDLELITYQSNAKSRLAGKYHIVGLEGLLVDNFQKISEEIPEKFRGKNGISEDNPEKFRKKPPHIQEENIREENNINPPISPQVDEEENEPPIKEKPNPPFKTKKQEQLFAQFWNEYPKKVAKKDAERAWSKIPLDDLLFKRIMAGLDRARASPNWIKDKGQYIPHPATWLNGKRWEDEHGQYQAPGEEEKDFGFQYDKV